MSKFEKIIYNCIAIIVNIPLNLFVWTFIITKLGGDVILGLIFGGISTLICLFNIWKV